jgi:hypothetical protein
MAGSIFENIGYFYGVLIVCIILNQNAHTTDPLPLKSKVIPRLGIVSRSSVFCLVALLLLVLIPDRALSFTQGDLYRQA